MNFAFGIIIGRFMVWIVVKFMQYWWIVVGLVGGSIVGRLLAGIGVPQIIVIPVSWIVAGFFLVYLRKRIKEKKVQMPVSPWDIRG